MVWKRSIKEDEYPLVYRRFTGPSGLKYRIQDVCPDFSADVVEFMADDFLENEPMCRGVSMKSDENAVKDINALWTKALTHRLGLVCLLETSEGDVCILNGKPVIVGANVTTLASVDDKESEKFKSKLQFLLDGLSIITKQADIFKHYGVEEYLTAYGLSVHKDYRRQNIGIELLKARIPLCKAVGLKVTGTVFTAKASQILAMRSGFEVLCVITYKDYRDVHGVDFGYTGPETVEYMALKI